MTLKECWFFVGGGTLKTINRISDVIARLKLRRKNYFRRMSFIVLMSGLLVSFQNCSQGKFDIDKEQLSSLGETANVSGNTGTSTSPSMPTGPEAPTGALAPTQAEINAEIQKRLRCKSAVKVPVVTNAADFASKVISVKSGLAAGSGDVNMANYPMSITIDPSQGIDSSKYSVADGCTFQTQAEISVVSGEAGRDAVLNHGINNSGAALVVGTTNGTRAVDYMNNTLERMTTDNNNQGTRFTMGTNTLGVNYIINPGDDNDPRTTRCVDGSIYYKFRVTAATTALNQERPNYPGSNVGNAAASSGYYYFRVDSENNCWKESNLAKIMGAVSPSSIPAANSLLGTAVASDGDWVASISNSEGGTGYIYLFRKVSGSWTFFQKLKGSNGNGTMLTGLALRGGLLAVASSGDGLGYPGRVYLYNLDGSQLSLPFQVINSPQAPLAKFGSGVAITSANGVVIGDALGTGRAYIYSLNGGLYGAGAGASRSPSAIQEGSTIAASVQGFGANVVYQGNRLLVGAYKGNEGYAGSVHIFDAGGGSFGSPIHKYAPAGISSAANFGAAIAFDGTSLVVGAYENATAGNVAGAIVYYNDYSASVAPRVIQGGAAEERFGVSVAIIGGSVYVGSRGGTGSSGTVSRYLKTSLAATGGYSSRIFLQRSHDAVNGESFSYSMSVINGASVPTLVISSQTKTYTVGVGDSRSKAGGLYVYEVK